MLMRLYIWYCSLDVIFQRTILEFIVFEFSVIKLMNFCNFCWLHKSEEEEEKRKLSIVSVPQYNGQKKPSSQEYSFNLVQPI